MRALIILGAVLLSVAPADAQRAKPVEPKVTISEDARRKTLEHMVSLAKEQQVQLDAALISEREVQSQLLTATRELVEAGHKALALQKAIDAQTDELNEAIRQRAEALKERDAIEKRYHRLKMLVCGLVAALLFLLIPKVSGMVPFPYKYALYAAPVAVAGLLWFIL